MTNLEPKTGLTFWQLIVSIPSQVFPGIPVIHAINKKWCTEKEVVFTFLLENDSDAFNLVAGLILFLKATPDPWYLSMFTAEAKIRHASSAWDIATGQVFKQTNLKLMNS